jgi:hypothetical protein
MMPKKKEKIGILPIEFYGSPLPYEMKRKYKKKERRGIRTGGSCVEIPECSTQPPKPLSCAPCGWGRWIRLVNWKCLEKGTIL